MDSITKFLLLLKKSEADYLKNIIFPKIASLDLDDLDVKKMQGYPFWRVRYGRIRVIFAKENGKGIIVKVGFRKDIYQKLK